MNTLLNYSRAHTGLTSAAGRGELHRNRGVMDPDRGAHDFQNVRYFSPAPKNILVPLTLASGSYAALAIARNLAREFNAKLTLLHVVQLNIAGEERGIHRTRLVNELCRNAELQLTELAAGMCGSIAAEVVVCEGRPADAIVQTATRLKADTIVLHTRGNCGWSKWLHRRTAAKVVRQAPCGILLVSPAKRGTAVNLMFVDHATVNQQSECLVNQENQNPFRSILRVLFS
jgi:nucleotide-binding universal stress UspA family protein